MKGVVSVTILSCAALLLTCVKGQPPKGCCIEAKQWSASMTDLSTINSKAITVSQNQVDFVKQMQVVVNTTYDPASGSKINGRIVFDFNKKEAYTISSDSKTCSKAPTIFPLIRCIPADAQYMGSSYLGPVAGPVQYDGWRFSAGSIKVTLAMTKNGCVPLVEGVSVPAAPPPFDSQLYLFTTFNTTLVDPSQFILPSSCN